MMSHDARDTNHDGKVSLVEKVKDKLHLGHKDAAATHHTTTNHHTTPIVGASSAHHTTPVIGTVPLAGVATTAMPLASSGMPLAGSTMPLAGSTAFADSRDLNRDGYVSTSEKLATAGGLRSGMADSRDLNRDGYVSTSEKLAAAGGLHSSGMPLASSAMPLAGSTAFADSRDLNRDGYVSTSEKLAAGAHLGAAAGFRDEAVLRLHEEQLAISKREVGAGEVDIHKRVQSETVQQTIPVRREEVTVERRALHGVAEPGARIAAQDEIVRVPLFREEVIAEKRIVPVEEVIVRKTEVVDQQTVGATLRSEYVETTQTNMATNISANISGAAFDARDLNRDGHVSMGEKLAAGSASHNATGFGDSRDLNRDGKVSLGEKLKTAPDANRDGKVSMGEKLKAAARG